MVIDILFRYHLARVPDVTSAESKLIVFTKDANWIVPMHKSSQLEVVSCQRLKKASALEQTGLGMLLLELC